MSFQPWIAPFPDDGAHRLTLESCGGLVTSGFCAVPELSAEFFHPEGHSSFLLCDQHIGLQTVTLPVLWQGISSVPESWAASGTGSRWRTEAGMRQFEAALTGKLVLNVGDGYLYHCVLTDISSPVWLGSAACRKTYTLQGIRTFPLQTLRFTANYTPTISCTSSLPRTDCILTLTNEITEAVSIVIRLGRTVFSASASSGALPGGTIVLDGIGKRLLVDGENQACLWSWTEFPWLAPGVNELQLIIDGVGAVPEGTLSWYPAFL